MCNNPQSVSAKKNRMRFQRVRIRAGKQLHFSFGVRLLTLLGFCLAVPVNGQEILPNFSSQNVESRIFARESNLEIAAFRIKKIFPDHRKFGFFRVQLFPMLVAEGVRLELSTNVLGDDWTEGFQCSWLPDSRRHTVEWRDVEITIKTPNPPRLCARQAQLAKPDLRVICSLKDVTLEVGEAKWQVARAKLCNEKGRPCVIWADDAGNHHWDLFSGEMRVQP
jgi:hypothetical protein